MTDMCNFPEIPADEVSKGTNFEVSWRLPHFFIYFMATAKEKAMCNDINCAQA